MHRPSPGSHTRDVSELAPGAGSNGERDPKRLVMTLELTGAKSYGFLMVIHVVEFRVDQSAYILVYNQTVRKDSEEMLGQSRLTGTGCSPKREEGRFRQCKSSISLLTPRQS